jgi:hypothetical protein
VQLAAKRLFENYLEAKGGVDFSAFCALVAFMAPGKVFGKGALPKLFEEIRCVCEWCLCLCLCGAWSCPASCWLPGGGCSVRARCVLPRLP